MQLYSISFPLSIYFLFLGIISKGVQTPIQNAPPNSELPSTAYTQTRTVAEASKATCV